MQNSQLDLELFIKKVGYQNEWFDLSFIDLQIVKDQLKDYLTNPNEDFEPYKWSSYSYIVKNEDFKNPKRLDQFIQLIDSDPNPHIYKGAITILLSKKQVDPKQLLSYKNSRILKEKALLEKIKNFA